MNIHTIMEVPSCDERSLVDKKKNEENLFGEIETERMKMSGRKRLWSRLSSSAGRHLKYKVNCNH